MTNSANMPTTLIKANSWKHVSSSFSRLVIIIDVIAGLILDWECDSFGRCGSNDMARHGPIIVAIDDGRCEG